VRCLFCAEEIQDEAVVCRHCGRNVLVGAVKIELRGTRYALGDSTSNEWAIWNIETGGQALARYPRGEVGWKQAWDQLQAWEGSGRSTPAAATQPGQVWGILSIACGAVGLLILPIIFGPLALVFGIVGLSMNYNVAWFGIILGAIDTVIVFTALNELNNILD
jgi:hypothetical protein